jgi:hypothetical protein
MIMKPDFIGTFLWITGFFIFVISFGMNTISPDILFNAEINSSPERIENSKTGNGEDLNGSFSGQQNCPYTEFFRQIIAFINGSVKSVPPDDCFIVQNYEGTGNAPEYGNYKKRITFYCQYGHSGTQNGEVCYGELFSKFREFLIKNGYSLVVKEDHSMTGWINQLYSAAKNGRGFLFVYESESAASMGYAKISIVK